MKNSLAPILGLGLLALQALGSEPAAPASPARSIPMDQLGAEAQKQYSGEGISIQPTAEGARLRAAFQDLEGKVTPEGLWLTSTSEEARTEERFRVLAVGIGASSPSTALARTGRVQTESEVVRLIRPGVMEEYRVSMGGIRQDFLIPQRPPGQGELTLALEVSGARAEAADYGARLTLAGSGRQIAYSRLHVTDATGRELPAKMEVRAADRLHIRVDATTAVYPVRIDPTFSDADWVSLGGVPGTDYEVSAVAADASGNLYIGGGFSLVGTVKANCIAKWDGSTWSALGTGLGKANVSSLPWLPYVDVIKISGSDVYVGGFFGKAGGVNANGVAKWNGTTWSAVGTLLDSVVQDLVVSGTTVYAVGNIKLTEAPTTNVSVARWDGTSWTSLASQPDFYPSRVALLGSDLYVSGSFTSPSRGLARWNGSGWVAVGAALNGIVTDMTVSGGSLYVTGEFTKAGTLTVNRVAQWNGTAWSALGSGLPGRTERVTVAGSTVYVAHYLTNPNSTLQISRWNGSAWSVIAIPGNTQWGANGRIYALGMAGSTFYACGDFASVSGVPAVNIAQWNGSAWSALTAGLDGEVQTMAVSGSNLYIGGRFTTVGGVVAKSVACWNGSAWAALGTGLSYSSSSLPEVYAMAVAGSDVYVGGAFSTAGGTAVNNIAKWNGSNWSALGSGTSNQVRAILCAGTDVYAGGYFNTADGQTNGIGKWNGSTWSALGSGLLYKDPADGVLGGGQCNALAMAGGHLYVGGYISQAGGKATAGIARWDGAAWFPLGQV